METSLFLNNKNGCFSLQALPISAQFSPVYGIACGDYDNDGKKDIVLAGNFFEAKPQVGIYDANYGLLLKGDGNGGFISVPALKSGIRIKGEVKNIATIKTQRGGEKLVFVLNNGAPVMYSRR